MKHWFIILFTIISIQSYAQDTVKHMMTRGPRRSAVLDTNQVVYDEQGKALHFYQYEKLINSGEYTFMTKGEPPTDPNAKRYLKKLTVAEKNLSYDMMKEALKVKSPVLQESMQLNITPLTTVFNASELEGKVIVLIFWAADCPPCTEGFDSLNDFLKQIHNPEDLMLIAITPDSKDKANAKLKEKPLLYAQLLSDAGAVMNDYQLHHYPSFVVADKSHTIRYSSSGIGPMSLVTFKNVIKAVLFQ